MIVRAPNAGSLSGFIPTPYLFRFLSWGPRIRLLWAEGLWLAPSVMARTEPFGRVRRAIWVCRIWGSEGLGFRGLGFSVVSFLGSSWVMVFIMVAYGMVCLYRACPVYTQPLCLSGLRPSLGPSTLDPTCSYRPLAAQSVLRKKWFSQGKPFVELLDSDLRTRALGLWFGSRVQGQCRAYARVMGQFRSESLAD